MIKKMLLLVAVSISFLNISIIVSAPNAEIKGFFDLVGDPDALVPQFQIAFDGIHSVNDREGFFTIPCVNQIGDKFSLIIADDVTWQLGKKNTIKNFILESCKEYKHYLFSRSEVALCGWTWEEIIDNKNIEIPEQAIVVRMNPRFVSHLEAWDSVTMLPHIIKLPKIMLHQSVNNNTYALEKESAVSLLTALDTQKFHGKNKGCSAKHNKGLIYTETHSLN